jgi:tRNA (guanine-N7-)-methyltransferase
MPRKKRKKKIEVDFFENVFQEKHGNIEEQAIKFFGGVPENITLEIGCGHGIFSNAMAEKFPQRRFLGLDLKTNRLWNASKSATEKGLKNVAFVYLNANKLHETFRQIKFEEIWITFPDPQIKRRAAKRRLTSPAYIEIYKRVALPETPVYLKTDDDFTYNYTLEVLNELNIKPEISIFDLYAEENLNEIFTLKTRYEEYHLEKGRKIKLIMFRI